MGATYGNIPLRGPTQAQAIRAVRELRLVAWVSPTVQGITVVYDCRCEDDGDVVPAVTMRLSERLGCAAWGVYVYDSDILRYTLARDGRVLDEYDSRPGYFSPLGSGPPRGGNAAVLCREMQLAPASVAQVRRILRDPDHTTHYLFEERRHGDLMLELKHPDLAYLMRHSDFRRDEPLPEGYTAEQFTQMRGEWCLVPYPFEVGGWLRSWKLIAAGAAALAAALFLSLRRRGKGDGLSRRQFLALLAAGALTAAAGTAEDGPRPA
jgi:hypothetical protein